MTRPTISRGDSGSDVDLVQTCLEVPADGDFGSVTEEAVKQFQRDQELDDDGVVGPDTWEALERSYDLPPYPPPLLPPLDQATQNAITSMAITHPISRYNWTGRGTAPLGYVKGFAIAYSTVIRKWAVLDTSAMEMAKRNSHRPDKDVLSWYDGIFLDNDMSNDRDGIDTLRHLFVLIMGLGMRESSGFYCEGRDMSAENVQSDTAEAGLFQQSWNSHVCSNEIQKLFDEYGDGLSDDPPEQCSLMWFAEGVTCSASDWQNYGSGQGRDFQQLCKNCPQFAVEACAIGLRHLRQHWGPINRYEVEVVPDADDMLRIVQDLTFLTG